MRKKTIEDYLLSVYFIYEEQSDKSEGVKSAEVAKLLGISKPSVSEAVGKLKKMKLVKAKPYGNIFFTRKGLKEVRKIVHARRVIGVFLVKCLGFDPDKIYDDIHVLEHALSDKVVRKLDKFVGHPKVCPHGKKIHVLGMKSE